MMDVAEKELVKPAVPEAPSVSEGSPVSLKDIRRVESVEDLRNTAGPEVFEASNANIYRFPNTATPDTSFSGSAEIVEAVDASPMAEGASYDDTVPGPHNAPRGPIAEAAAEIAIPAVAEQPLAEAKVVPVETAETPAAQTEIAETQPAQPEVAESVPAPGEAELRTAQERLATIKSESVGLFQDTVGAKAQGLSEKMRGAWSKFTDYSRSPVKQYVDRLNTATEAFSAVMQGKEAARQFAVVDGKIVRGAEPTAETDPFLKRKREVLDGLSRAANVEQETGEVSTEAAEETAAAQSEEALPEAVLDRPAVIEQFQQRYGEEVQAIGSLEELADFARRFDAIPGSQEDIPGQETAAAILALKDGLSPRFVTRTGGLRAKAEALLGGRQEPAFEETDAVAEAVGEAAFFAEQPAEGAFDVGTAESPIELVDTYKKAAEAFADPEMADFITNAREASQKLGDRADEYFVSAMNDRYGSGVGEAILAVQNRPGGQEELAKLNQDGLLQGPAAAMLVEEMFVRRMEESETPPTEWRFADDGLDAAARSGMAVELRNGRLQTVENERSRLERRELLDNYEGSAASNLDLASQADAAQQEYARLAALAQNKRPLEANRSLIETQRRADGEISYRAYDYTYHFDDEKDSQETLRLAIADQRLKADLLASITDAAASGEGSLQQSLEAAAQRLLDKESAAVEVGQNEDGTEITAFEPGKHQLVLSYKDGMARIKVERSRMPEQAGDGRFASEFNQG